MRLSEKETRYRMKIIQESHYNKSEQRILDEAAAEMSRSYQDIYEAQRGGAVYFFMSVIGSMRASRAFADLGNSFSVFSEAASRFTKAFFEVNQ